MIFLLAGTLGTFRTETIRTIMQFGYLSVFSLVDFGIFILIYVISFYT